MKVGKITRFETCQLSFSLPSMIDIWPCPFYLSQSNSSPCQLPVTISCDQHAIEGEAHSFCPSVSSSCGNSVGRSSHDSARFEEADESKERRWWEWLICISGRSTGYKDLVMPWCEALGISPSLVALYVILFHRIDNINLVYNITVKRPYELMNVVILFIFKVVCFYNLGSDMFFCIQRTDESERQDEEAGFDNASCRFVSLFGERSGLRKFEKFTWKQWR